MFSPLMNHVYATEMARTIFALTWIYSMLTGICYSCEVMVTQKETEGIAGYTSILNCSHTGCPRLRELKWYKGTFPDREMFLEKHNGDPEFVYQPYRDRFSIVDQADLQIYDVRKEDEAVYTCLVHDHNFDVTDSKTVKFYVKEPLPPDVVNITTHTVPIIEGQTVNMTCIATGTRLKFHWQHGGRTIPVSEKYALNEDGSQLLITDVHRSDAGNITCIATNILANERMTVTLDVIFPPDQFDICKTSIQGHEDHFTEGEMLELWCASGSANPAADVKWFRNDMLVTSGISETEITSGHYNGYISTVHLKLNITASDHGTEFRCVASSDTYFPGEDYLSLTLKLNVHYKPRLVSHGDVTASVGETAVLACNISSNPPANITWFDPSENIVNNSTANSVVHEVWRGVQAKSSLTKFEVNVHASGSYIIEVGNEIGQSEITINLTVIEHDNIIIPIVAALSLFVFLILCVLVIWLVVKKIRGGGCAARVTEPQQQREVTESSNKESQTGGSDNLLSSASAASPVVNDPKGDGDTGRVTEPQQQREETESANKENPTGRSDTLSSSAPAASPEKESRLAPLRMLYAKLNDNLGAEKHKTLLTLVGDKINERQQEQLKTPAELFQNLEVHGHIKESDLSLLVELFEEMKLPKLVEMVRKCERLLKSEGSK